MGILAVLIAVLVAAPVSAAVVRALGLKGLPSIVLPVVLGGSIGLLSVWLL